MTLQVSKLQPRDGYHARGGKNFALHLLRLIPPDHINAADYTAMPVAVDVKQAIASE